METYKGMTTEQRDTAKAVDKKNTLKIITPNDPKGIERLSEPSVECNNPNKVSRALRYLGATAVHNADRCLCLTANQIGFPIKLFMLRPGVKTNKDAGYIACLNPKILAAGGGIKSMYEGCLSFPDQEAARCRRYKWVVLRWFDPLIGKPMRRKFTGLDAVMVQHAFDHFKGKLI